MCVKYRLLDLSLLPTTHKWMAVSSLVIGMCRLAMASVFVVLLHFIAEGFDDMVKTQGVSAVFYVMALSTLLTSIVLKKVPHIVLGVINIILLLIYTVVTGGLIFFLSEETHIPYGPGLLAATCVEWLLTLMAATQHFYRLVLMNATPVCHVNSIVRHDREDEDHMEESNPSL